MFVKQEKICLYASTRNGHRKRCVNIFQEIYIDIVNYLVFARHFLVLLLVTLLAVLLTSSSTCTPLQLHIPQSVLPCEHAFQDLRVLRYSRSKV